MSEINDGGPAFAHAATVWTNPDGSQNGHPPQTGMTLRDWFAGQALAGLITRLPNDDRLAYLMPWDAASLAYEHADAMLAERAKAEGSTDG